LPFKPRSMDSFLIRGLVSNWRFNAQPGPVIVKHAGSFCKPTDEPMSNSRHTI